MQYFLLIGTVVLGDKNHDKAVTVKKNVRHTAQLKFASETKNTKKLHKNCKNNTTTTTDNINWVSTFFRLFFELE